MTTKRKQKEKNTHHWREKKTEQREKKIENDYATTQVRVSSDDDDNLAHAAFSFGRLVHSRSIHLFVLSIWLFSFLSQAFRLVLGWWVFFFSAFLFVCATELPMLLTLTRIVNERQSEWMSERAKAETASHHLSAFLDLFSFIFKAIVMFVVVLYASHYIAMHRLWLSYFSTSLLLHFFLSPNHSNGKLNSPTMCQKRNTLLSSSSSSW